MGTKIKPAFKSEFPRVSEGWHLFRIVEPKIDTIAPEDREEKDGIKNDKNFVVRSAVEGGDEDGVELQDFCANHSKKEFGLSRLAGVMIKTESIPADVVEIDVDTMRNEKFETKFKMSLPKRLFGGRIVHSKMKSRDDPTKELTFANIVEYVTVKEYNDIIAKQAQKGVEGKGKGQDKGVGEKSAETVIGKPTEAPKDPWA